MSVAEDYFDEVIKEALILQRYHALKANEDSHHTYGMIHQGRISLRNIS
ncbi:hypothetical protein [Anaerosolibacter carboniphilus]|nr:hypothetical protein [Anaerosolibacter carboniphilus]